MNLLVSLFPDLIWNGALNYKAENYRREIWRGHSEGFSCLDSTTQTVKREVQTLKSK